MSLGKGLIVAGLALVALGLVVMLGSHFGVKLFRLPGDLVWRGKNTTVYFPIATSILLSLLLTLLFSLWGRR